jgi:AraC-like DNA-binding protein
MEQHLSLSEAQMSIMIGNLLLELSKEAALEGDREEDGIKKVTTYLTENFSKKITLEEMADMAGLSPYHFNRKYKKETGVTPHQFLLSTRISAAKYSLSNSNMTISEIAISCGFIDESAFCYCFKKREGITPNEYRKNAIGSASLS